MNKFYPLRLKPQLVEKVWGGRWLIDNLARPGQAESRLGESWEIFSGSSVTNGAWQGKTLGELYQEYGAAFGGAVSAKYPQFPLLVKFIDARENLSVQVHPDDKLAQALENYPFGKSEMWYIMAAEPGARILYGLNEQIASVAELRTALEKGTIEEYIASVPVKAGDVVYLPAGTVHALCAGIVVYELQQESDITYRLYDWGRQGREIHVDKGLQAIKLEARNLKITHPPLAPFDGYNSTVVVNSPYFSCEVLEVANNVVRAADDQSFVLISGISGSGRISSPNGTFTDETITAGDSFFIPANLSYHLITGNANEPLRLIIGRAN